jgi:hypothetical protein
MGALSNFFLLLEKQKRDISFSLEDQKKKEK